MAVTRVEAVRQLFADRGANVSERTITEILLALYVLDAVKENHHAEVRGSSADGEKVTVVVSAREIRDAIRKWC